MQQLILEIIEVCLIPLLGVLTTYIVKYINQKSAEVSVNIDSALAQKYVTMLAQTITDCVIATNQTYVDSLKKQNAFDMEAQKKAFEKTQEAVMAILSDEAKVYLATFYGDLDSYITSQIEASVKLNK